MPDPFNLCQTHRERARQGFTDAELTELALAADPDAPLPDDAVPLVDERHDAGLLPAWYMPAPSLRRTRRRTLVLSVVVLALVVLNVVGLCVTYGVPDPVWR